MNFQNYSKIFCNLMFQGEFLTTPECQTLIDFFEQNIAYSEPSTVNLLLDNQPKIRSSTSMFIDEAMHPTFPSMIEKIGNIVYELNNSHWRFTLGSSINWFQIIKYQQNDHYDWHVDWNPDPMSCTRKLSIVIQLSQAEDYKDCELVLRNGNSKVTFTKQRGYGIVFPSFVLHKVTPLTSGTRYSLVFWVEGPSFQ